jgi:hypothetical protein
MLSDPKDADRCRVTAGHADTEVEQRLYPVSG